MKLGFVNLRAAACAAGGALVCGGCYSTATLHTARPIEPGTAQGGVAVGAYMGEDDGELQALPTLEGQVRFGISDYVDFGAHLTDFAVLSLDLNCAVLLTESTAVSLDPMIEFTFGTYAWLPVLWDFYTSRGLTLTASARVGYYWLDLHDDDDDDDWLLDNLEVDAWLWGLGLAAQIPFAGGEAAFAPEVRAIWPLEGGGNGEPLISASLGLVF